MQKPDRFREKTGSKKGFQQDFEKKPGPVFDRFREKTGYKKCFQWVSEKNQDRFSQENLRKSRVSAGKPDPVFAGKPWVVLVFLQKPRRWGGFSAETGLGFRRKTRSGFSAKTGSGLCLLARLCILRLILKSIDMDLMNINSLERIYSVVYIVRIRCFCRNPIGFFFAKNN